MLLDEDTRSLLAIYTIVVALLSVWALYSRHFWKKRCQKAEKTLDAAIYKDAYIRKHWPSAIPTQTEADGRFETMAIELAALAHKAKEQAERRKYLDAALQKLREVEDGVSLSAAAYKALGVDKSSLQDQRTQAASEEGRLNEDFKGLHNEFYLYFDYVEACGLKVRWEKDGAVAIRNYRSYLPGAVLQQVGT